MKKDLATKVIGSSVAIFICVGLVYFLLGLGAGKSLTSAPKDKEANNTISRPIVRPSPKEAPRNVQPQEKASGPGLSAIAQAEAALEDPDVGKRLQAVLFLRNQFSVEAMALLARYLNDKEGVVVKSAINSLAAIGLDTANEVLKKQILDLLLEKAKDKDFSLRGHALITCAKFGEDDRTFRLIGEFIAEEGDKGTAFAARALAFMVSPAIFPYVSEILKKTKDAEISRNAYALLAKIGTQEALTMILQGLSSRMEIDRVNAAWALSLKNEQVSNALLIDAIAANKLDDSVLGAIGSSPAGPAVYDELLNMNIPKEDKLHYLEVLAGSAVSAPSEIRDGLAAVFLSFFKSSDPDLKLAAIKALGNTGSTTDQSKVLAAEFDSPDFLVRGAALEAFMSYCTPSTYKELKKLWYDEDEKIRRTAFFLSQSFLNKSDLEDLNKAVNHKDGFIADYAKTAIRHITEDPTKQNG